MRFIVDTDQGHVIIGWVVPDNPLAISRVAVSVDGRRVAEIPATEIVADLRDSGQHTTGQCRFYVNEETVPGLSDFARLEIHDVDTNVLIYRRTPNPIPREQRLILLNTGIYPETTLQAALYPHFRLSYFGIGKFSEEILTVLFETPNLTSCFMSGSIPLPRYEPHFVYNETLTTMLVQDPFVELATRMLWLRDRAGLAEDSAQSWALGDLAGAARFTKEYDYADVKSLKRLFRMLPEAAYRLLYNPLTRLLATRFPDDRIYPANSIIAVEFLSRIAVVGHRDYFEAFAATLFDRLGIDAPVPTASPIPPAIHDLADRLRPLKVAQDFLNFDMVMSDGVRKSIEKNWRD